MYMSQDITVTSLVASLTRSDRGVSRPAINSSYCAEHAIRHDAVPLPFYVEPHLSYEALPSPSNSEETVQDDKFCFLISAPAAVGKSTLAQHIHHALRDSGSTVLYIPLQNAKIGHDFFAGRLSGIFPNATRHEIFQAVFSGRVVLLFDGYDEVSMSNDQILMNKLFISEIVAEYKKYRASGGYSDAVHCVLVPNGVLRLWCLRRSRSVCTAAPD